MIQSQMSEKLKQTSSILSDALVVVWIYSISLLSRPGLKWQLRVLHLSNLGPSCLCICCFSYILNFLRTSELTLPCDFKETELLRKEADFYQIEPLIQCLGDPKPVLPYPTDTYEEVVELSSTRKLSKYSNPVAVIITQLTITTKVRANRSAWGRTDWQNYLSYQNLARWIHESYKQNHY